MIMVMVLPLLNLASATCGTTAATSAARPDEQKSSRHSATSQTLPLRARRPAAMTGAARERTLRRYWKHGRLSSARGGGGADNRLHTRGGIEFAQSRTKLGMNDQVDGIRKANCRCRS